MSKLETVIYIVGPKRSWEFQAKHVKRIFLFILLIFLGLGLTILYLQYNHLGALRKSADQLDQETLKNEKLLALLAKIKEQGMDANSSGITTDIDLMKQQKLNEQQLILIDQQRKELGELKGVLKQRERVVQQFQLEKQSTKDQVISLQEKLRKTREELQQTDAEKKTTIEQKKELQTDLAQVKKLLDQKRQIEEKTKKDSKSTLVNNYVISTSNMKMKLSGTKLNASFRINNLTEQRQIGRVGVYLTSLIESAKTIPYASGKTSSYSINRFKNIMKTLSGYKKDQKIRIVVWNQNKVILLDEIHSLP